MRSNKVESLEYIKGTNDADMVIAQEKMMEIQNQTIIKAIAKIRELHNRVKELEDIIDDMKEQETLRYESELGMDI